VEGATVGGQVFLTAATYEQIRDVAEVSEPVAIQMKGLTEALLLYDLRGLRGRFAPPATQSDHDSDASVSLPVRCCLICGTIVGTDRVDGRVLRIGPHEAAGAARSAASPTHQYQAPARLSRQRRRVDGHARGAGRRGFTHAHPLHLDERG
jgi:hypothetical protein